MDMEMQFGHGHAAWTWTCIMDMDVDYYWTGAVGYNYVKAGNESTSTMYANFVNVLQC
jgi:hypothetical protein